MPIAVPPLKEKRDATVHQKVPGGFLTCVYDADGEIENIFVARTKGGHAVGLQLYFWDEGEHITCKTESGLSGQVFSDGAVNWGTVYDDDGPSDPGRKIAKEEWLAECLEKMVAGLGRDR